MGMPGLAPLTAEEANQKLKEAVNLLTDDIKVIEKETAEQLKEMKA